MLSGAAVMPPVPVSVRAGGDDAYEAIVSELIRVEEAARASGAAQAGGGAVSAAGRHLEGFISHMDMRVSPLESSAQVYREMRGFLKNRARDAVKKTADHVDTLLDADSEVLVDAEAEIDGNNVEREHTVTLDRKS